ncbi:hypothetical protein BKA65DRAFT_481375 [Rhexocercosporidium sp. MPI-PUGE-AT-0058]|nr:hypothetical protein BKA65DRAFT_481375 [Rhexocercosporidium sp. MPI-PUGE-AT-0058]
MCITKVYFEEACGHATWALERCADGRGGSCEHSTERSVRDAFCSECAIDLTLISHPETREATRRDFDRRTRLDVARDIQEAFNADLAEGHILASIHPGRISHQDARELAHEQRRILQRIGDDDVFVWDIDRLDGFLDDHNRARVLGAALFRIPEQILRGLTHTQLRDHVDSLSDELDQRRNQLRLDSSRLQRARRLLATSEPRDPTGRTRAERQVKEQMTRARAIPSILAAVEIHSMGATEADRACTVCTDPLGVAQGDHDAEEPCSLPCGHIIGRACITKWLMSNTSCPLCRRDYKIELSRSPDVIQDLLAVAPAEPLREISPEARREAQIAQSRGQRDEQAPEHEASIDDLDQPAGDANFLDELAVATRASVQQIVQQQIEARHEAQREMLSPMRNAVRDQMQLTDAASNSRSRRRRWRLEELEAQLAEDLEDEAAIISHQVVFVSEMNILDQHIQSLIADREVMLLDVPGYEGDNLIVRAHDDILDDAYRVRHLLRQAQAQAERETERLRLDIEQAYIDLDSAYVYSGYHDELGLDENHGILDGEQTSEVRLEAQQPRVPDNSPERELEEGEIDHFLQLFE